MEIHLIESCPQMILNFCNYPEKLPETKKKLFVFPPPAPQSSPASAPASFLHL